MKMLICGLAMSLGMMATSAQAEQVINVDGEVYFLSQLTKNCQNITGDPAAQIACFAALSQLIEEQGSAVQTNGEAVTQAIEALRTAATYQGEESGLAVKGTDCNVQFVYYGNYFHISRRNISSVDLFSAAFNAADFQFDQTVQLQGGMVPMLRGALKPGATAQVSGGVALESAMYSFPARAAGLPLADYAEEVVAALPVTESQSFDFVLIHPSKSDASAEILGAFEQLVAACKG